MENVIAMSLTPSKLRKAKEWKEIWAYYNASLSTGLDEKTIIKACVNKFGHATPTIMKCINNRGVLVKGL